MYECDLWQERKKVNLKITRMQGWKLHQLLLKARTPPAVSKPLSSFISYTYDLCNYISHTCIQKLQFFLRHEMPFISRKDALGQTMF